jgi:hypothetical protein
MSYLSEILAKPPEDRGPCWLWPGKLRDSDGRPHVTLGMDDAVRFGQLDAFAYRITYQALRGPIPEGLVLDHLCRTPACVNPWHLEPVTQAVNVQRAKAHPGNVRRLSSGRWQARFSYRGNTYKAPDTFGTQDDARAWLDANYPGRGA